MKKVLLVIMGLFLTVGCSCSNDLAADAVEKYLDNYKALSDSVLTDIDDLIEREELNDKEKDAYKEVLKRQYRDLNYTILNEDYDGDTAIVSAKITVYDLYKSTKEANDYLNSNPDEFLSNGSYDKEKFLDYKLDLMQKEEDTISYTITFKTIKVSGKWQVEQPNDTTLEKIHGIYNYDENTN